MPAKFKKTKTNKRRRNHSRISRRRSTGGMFRAASSATGRAFNKLMGKGFDRLDKAKQVAEAIAKGAAQTQTPETFTPAKLSRTFSASPSSPYRMSETPRSSHSAMPGSDFKTPTKGNQNDAHVVPPRLGTRTRRRETPEERSRRLGLIVAPTLHNSTTVVGTLFP